MPSPTPRRRAAPPPSRAARARQRFAAVRKGKLPFVLWLLVVGAGVAAEVASVVARGPEALAGAGAVAISSAYTWALAARTGGRPVVFGALALVLGVGVLVWDMDVLRAGAAAMTCVVSAILAVIATVPAVRFAHTVRETLFAVLLASVGGLATVGFEPVVNLGTFDYATLGLALLGAFAVVFRLGAGLHGLGRRGLVAVLVGSVLLALTLAYAELLQRYGSPALVESLLDGVRWSRHHLGAFPRPIESVLGVPALAWGCHMRARRRQGWWVCAFGVAASAPAASALLNPAISTTESVLSVTYGVVVGLLLGFAMIRLDLAFTGPRGSRARQAEEAAAARPEPARTRALL